jgi:iron complex outermembrane receptor protein
MRTPNVPTQPNYKNATSYFVAGASALAMTVCLGATPVTAQSSSDQSASAQSTSGPSTIRTLEEIIVTARKRSESLQDVPFSINAQTEGRMRDSGINNVEEIARNVAGFTVQNLGPGQSQVAIRGISAGQIVRDQPGVKEQVGVYLDESVLSLSLFTPDLDLFDLNRVEVLRGPQGTLFGSGSLSGTVRYITNKPNVDDVEFTMEAGLTSIDGGSEGGNVRGMLNIPIVKGKAAIRAVGYYNYTPGYIDAVQPDLSVNKDVNNVDSYGGRLALELRPTDNLTITPRVVVQKVDADGFNRVDLYNILGNPFTTTRPAVTLGKREQFTQIEEDFDDDFLLLDNTIQLDVGSVSLTSVTSYTERDVLVVRDSTQLSGSITFQVFGAPEDVFTIDAPLIDGTDVEMFTQELRIASNSDSALQWVFGAFYSDIDREYNQQLVVPGFEAATGIPTVGLVNPKDVLFFSRIPYNFEQFALFGEASYDLTDALSVTAGLRWFDFKETRELNFDGIFADQTIAEPGKTSSSGVSPRFMVSYDINPDVILNAQVSKGFRLGGINDPLNEPLCTDADKVTFGGRPDFANETLWNYEVGAKTSFMSGRGSFNVAAFYSDINNLQATLDAGTCSSRIVFNVDKARSMGVEAELFMQATDELSFGINGSYTDSELRSTVTSTDENGVTSVVAGIQKGNRLPTVPKIQLSANATYEKPIFDETSGFFTVNVQHVGSRFTQIGDQAAGFGTIDLTAIPIGNPTATSFSFNPKMPDYQIGNLRVGLRTGTWEVAFFVNNIWDERAVLSLDRERGTLARVGFHTNQPRTFGLMGRITY